MSLASKRLYSCRLHATHADHMSVETYASVSDKTAGTEIAGQENDGQRCSRYKIWDT